MGCCAFGCLTLLIIGFLFVAGVIGTAWYVYHKLATTELISDRPAEVRLEPPTDAEFAAAESALARLKTRTGREETVAFTATDLNALVARDRDFRDLEKKVRIDIQDSVMTTTLSAPLDSLFWDGKGRRWFNGTLRLRGSYAAPEFDVELESISGGDYEVPYFVLSQINSWINWALNDNRNHWDDGDFDSEVWKRIKSIRLEGDKMLVTTKAE